MADVTRKCLSELEQEIYSWQYDVDGFGLEGQEKLKQSTVLISRCGGLGGWWLTSWRLPASAN